MKIQILLASFVGLVVGLVVGLLVGAGAAWMLATHNAGKTPTNGDATAVMHDPNVTPWTSSEVAAPDSVEGQLRSQGKRWVRTTGEITVGAYVQDAYEGRLGQPKGRGAIGKVLLISTGDNGVRAAMVDFGRGNSGGINLSELSLVKIVPE
jgi:hypothetical protein